MRSYCAATDQTWYAIGAPTPRGDKINGATKKVASEIVKRLIKTLPPKGGATIVTHSYFNATVGSTSEAFLAGK